MPPATVIICIEAYKSCHTVVGGQRTVALSAVTVNATLGLVSSLAGL